MSGLLSFEVVGLDDVKMGLAAVIDDAKDLSPFWREIWAPKYFGIVQDLFATGGRSRGAGGRFSGGAWAPLSPTYKAWKEKHFPGRPILVRSGELQDSLRWQVGAGLGPGGVFQATPSYVIAGTSVPWAKFHKSGTSNMPARDFMPPADPVVFAPLLKTWLMRHAKK